MKKNIVIIGLASICLVIGLTGDSWAKRFTNDNRHNNRDGQHQNWNQPRQPRSIRSHYPKQNHYRPKFRGNSEYYNRHRHRPSPRFRPQYHNKGPHYRPGYHRGHPKRFPMRHPHPVVNNYYGSIESDSLSQDQYHLTASISDPQFSFSIGVSGTH